MIKLTSEYLVVIEQTEANPFAQTCETAVDFIRLLETNEDIKIKDNTFAYKTETSCLISIETEKVHGRSQRFFHIVVIFKGEESEIDSYASLLRAFRSVIKRIGAHVETLNDDLSAYYAEKSYPIIHRLENLMRKLINYFMLTQVGKEWLLEELPKDVKTTIEKGKRAEQDSDTLHRANFDELGDVLFKASPARDVSELYNLFDSVGDTAGLDLTALRGFRPRSNWDKYFSKLVNCKDEYIKTRWDDLYKLRCRVAHNSTINKNDYDTIIKLAGEISEKLHDAIKNIGKIEVPEDEKETIVEDVVSNLNTLSGEFIHLWRIYEIALNDFAVAHSIINNSDSASTKLRIRYALTLILKDLYNASKIPEEIYLLSIEVMQFRNQLVHGTSFSSDEQEVARYIEYLKELLDFFAKPQDVTTWKEEIILALAGLGGEANLIDIYNFVQRNTNRKLSETWRATIRRTLQSYSSDMKSYLGGEDLFEHVDTGRWALRQS
jgi:type III secretion system FlhB-like substrate exporter